MQSCREKKSIGITNIILANHQIVRGLSHRTGGVGNASVKTFLPDYEPGRNQTLSNLVVDPSEFKNDSETPF